MRNATSLSPRWRIEPERQPCNCEIAAAPVFPSRTSRNRRAAPAVISAAAGHPPSSHTPCSNCPAMTSHSRAVSRLGRGVAPTSARSRQATARGAAQKNLLPNSSTGPRQPVNPADHIGSARGTFPRAHFGAEPREGTYCLNRELIGIATENKAPPPSSPLRRSCRHSLISWPSRPGGRSPQPSPHRSRRAVVHRRC